MHIVYHYLSISGARKFILCSDDSSDGSRSDINSGREHEYSPGAPSCLAPASLYEL